ncbi:MAG: hypothetical protein KDI60_19990 [Xanthomonadales bacterium]|nr:hypothetical protein [Xanthomonadales bacterium]MCB1614016.1 hypothetical protein [Xanthomonadales bacterium]
MSVVERREGGRPSWSDLCVAVERGAVASAFYNALNRSMRSIVLFLAVLLSCPMFAQAQVTIRAGVNDLTLTYEYLGIGIESRCGSDWLLLERGFWKCVHRGAGGKLLVGSFGRMPSGYGLDQLIRGPIVGDRRLVFAKAGGPWTGGAPVHALDPVTMEFELIGALPEGGVIFGKTIHADYDGDGLPELVLPAQSGTPTLIVALPGGAGVPLSALANSPVAPSFVGQYDGDSQSEIGVVDFLTGFRLYDANSGLPEPFQLQGAVTTTFPVFSGDWDSDGVDEIAIKSTVTPGLALIDPNLSSVPQYVQFPGANPLMSSALGMVAWQSPGSRDLVVLGATLGVVDPVSSSLIAQFDFPRSPVNIETPAVTLDWDNDGDDDLLWRDFGLNELWLLRNPQGVEVVQRAASAKVVIGLTGAEPPQLAVAEQFHGADAEMLVHVRRRDPATLMLTDEADAIASMSAWNDRFEVADVHPQPGDEIILNSGRFLTVYSSSGSLLWQREIEDAAQNSFRGLVVADFTCSADSCRWLLTADNQGLRRFDGLDGSELWAGPFTGPKAVAALALTDLNGNGTLDMLYATGSAVGPATLVAVDADTHLQLWANPTSTRAVLAQRTNDPSQRLAVLYERGLLVYHDVTDGSEQRRAALIHPSMGFCDRCELRYLKQGETVGTWFITQMGPTGLLQIDRSLRMPASTASDEDANSVRTLSPGSVFIGTQDAAYTIEVSADGIFVDEFEGW